MALRIGTNVTGMMAQRQLGSTTQGLQRSLERLSSGQRINRAADDAAGLAISETLNAQVRGMNQAAANAQDSVNLIQTAEGGLEQTTAILHRMRELAIQAANDTYTQSDREKIQAEVHQLTEELTRIAQTTQYNGRTLLDGSIAQAAPSQDATAAIASNARVGTPGALEDLVTAVGTPYWGDGTPGPVTSNMTMTLRVEEGLNPGEIAIHVLTSDGTDFYIDDFNGPSGGGPFQNVTLGLNSNSQVAVQLTFGGATLTADDIGKEAIIQVNPGKAGDASDKALTFHVGANEGQIVKFGVADMQASALGLEGAGVLGSTEGISRLMAQNLIGSVDAALKTVNVARARMGALQNRLGHTVANLNVASENLLASNSRLRDVDVARESADLMRQQILLQAGTAMLAQANAAPRNALSLLG